MSDHSLAILGLLGTIVFGIVSVILGIRTLRPRILAWSGNSETVSTSGSHGELSIQFGDRAFAEVSITKVTIWNQGAGSISGADISHADPLRLQFAPGFEVLSVSILSETSPGVAAQTSIDKDDASSVRIFFEILNRSEGFTLRVLHCGGWEKANMLGTVRDVPQIMELPTESEPVREIVSRRIVVGTALVIFAFALILVSLLTLWIWGPDYFVSTGTFVGLVLGTLLGIGWRTLLPRALRLDDVERDAS